MTAAAITTDVREQGASAAGIRALLSAARWYRVDEKNGHRQTGRMDRSVFLTRAPAPSVLAEMRAEGLDVRAASYGGGCFVVETRREPSLENVGMALELRAFPECPTCENLCDTPELAAACCAPCERCERGLVLHELPLGGSEYVPCNCAAGEALRARRAGR